MVAASNNDYVFLTRWRVQATIEEVSAILDDAASLPRWWPSVYLEVRVLERRRALGVTSSPLVV